ncbi:transglycosylase SLT domain-containing protein [Streptacidiphilus sp. 4-A2]|nr:transglycosylase SLT domain-containing protein [Streptacidiphilus sp. 4-A2]
MGPVPADVGRRRQGADPGDRRDKVAAQIITTDAATKADAAKKAAAAKADAQAQAARKAEAAKAAEAKKAADARKAAQARQAAARKPAAAPQPAAPSGSPQQIAAQLVPADQLASFDQIISHESSWNVTAVNPSSGSYGLGQALPASKMASAGSDWRTNPATQIKWALNYMDSRYGSPNAAWQFWQANSWY